MRPTLATRPFFATRLAAAALLLTTAAATARAADLKAGDPAPALDVGQWVQGEPLKGIEKGKVHVVEFWATWCGPCRDTIPHLNELSKKHKDVTFVGVDIFEQDESKVAPFVKEMGDKMTYRVALDNKAKEKEGAMAVTWMKAAGQNGIPTAFIVDKDAKVAWIGHPAAMDKPLARIVDGTFDLKAEAARAAKEQALQADVQAKVIAKLRANQPDAALAALDEIVKANPDQASKLLGLKAGVLMQKKDLDGAYAVLDEMAADKDAEPMMLNQLAWSVLTAPPFAAKRDADRAMKWAKLAVEKTNAQEPQIVDTLARAHAVKGEWDKAVEQQGKAVGLAKDAKLKSGLEKTLAAYKEKKVPAGEE